MIILPLFSTFPSLVKEIPFIIFSNCLMFFGATDTKIRPWLSEKSLASTDSALGAIWVEILHPSIPPTQALATAIASPPLVTEIDEATISFFVIAFEVVEHTVLAGDEGCAIRHCAVVTGFYGLYKLS